MARALLILSALLWAGTSVVPVVSIQRAGEDDMASTSDSPLPTSEADGSSEKRGSEDASDTDEGKGSSNSSAPSIVLAIKVTQAERVWRNLPLKRLAVGLIGDLTLARADSHPVNRLESTIRLDRSAATDFAVRVPQIRRHAPPAAFV